MSKQVLQPPTWPRPKGYANGVAGRGQMIFVAGQVGWDERCEVVSDDFVAQVRQALGNIVAILAEAGAKPEHIMRMTWYVTDKDEYMAANRDIGKVFKELIGNYGIAMTAVQVAGLVEVGAKVEIEVTAMLPD
ncbi:aminoacrylate peracid reductase [Burkholderiales bacterium]|nr:MAG: RidA family protein [Burkholderiales bacterium]CAG1010223.1 aminoacrylate peracid reductase [Burkholderiales bacterium]